MNTLPQIGTVRESFLCNRLCGDACQNSAKSKVKRALVNNYQQICLLFLFYVFLPLMKGRELDIIKPAGELIMEKMSQLGVSQVELASRCRAHVQTISAVLKGQRDITIPLSLKIDAALGLEQGTVAVAQTEYQISVEARRQKVHDMKSRKMEILKKIKIAGGLWSYRGIPENLDDDSIIEAALVHMDLEDMPMLLEIWSKSHLKQVWKERLVSQGSRMNVLNYILAVKFFGVHHPDNYLARYAR